MKKNIAILAACFLLAGNPFISTAADETLNFGSAIPSEDEIAEALSQPSPAKFKARGIRPPQNRAISLEIIFEKNSYLLSEKATEVLGVLGKALQSSRLNKANFALEGHTDASGEADYNLDLSKKRAASVKEFLVKTYNIDSNRLKIEGKGESNLLPSVDPYSGSNRRVRIVNTGK